MSILDRYFELSDLAGKDEDKFQELVDLFSENALLEPAGSREVRGKNEIKEFFKVFFERNQVTRHVWKSRIEGNIHEVYWAVSGIRNTGEVFALKGIDIAQLDDSGRILNLKVQFMH